MTRQKRQQNRSLGNIEEMTPEEFTKSGYGAELLEKLPAAQAQTKQITQTGKGEVQIGEFEANAAGLYVPNDVTVAEINDVVPLLFALEGRVQLWIGDLLNKAEELEYGAIKRIAEKFNRDPQTLYNWKALSSSVTISLRRELLTEFPETKPLSKSHYELVQAMIPKDQKYWLSVALENNFGVAKLKSVILIDQNKSSTKAGKVTIFDTYISRSKNQRDIIQREINKNKNIAKWRQLVEQEIENYRTLLDEIQKK